MTRNITILVLGACLAAALVDRPALAHGFGGGGGRGGFAGGGGFRGGFAGGSMGGMRYGGGEMGGMRFGGGEMGGMRATAVARWAGCSPGGSRMDGMRLRRRVLVRSDAVVQLAGDVQSGGGRVPRV